MLPAKIQFIWPSGFRGEDFLEIDQSKTRIPVVALFANEMELNQVQYVYSFYKKTSIYFPIEVNVKNMRYFLEYSGRLIRFLNLSFIPSEL